MPAGGSTKCEPPAGRPRDCAVDERSRAWRRWAGAGAGRHGRRLACSGRVTRRAPGDRGSSVGTGGAAPRRRRAPAGRRRPGRCRAGACGGAGRDQPGGTGRLPARWRARSDARCSGCPPGSTGTPSAICWRPAAWRMVADEARDLLAAIPDDSAGRFRGPGQPHLGRTRRRRLQGGQRGRRRHAARPERLADLRRRPAPTTAAADRPLPGRVPRRLRPPGLRRPADRRRAGQPTARSNDGQRSPAEVLRDGHRAAADARPGSSTTWSWTARRSPAARTTWR